jgi:hypothetical protein
VSFSASNKSGSTEASSACIYAGITPQLRKDVSTAVQHGTIAVFLLVFVSGLVATLFTPAVSAREVVGITGSAGSSAVQRTILPGVADCLLHLQFIFFLGALTLRYPGFYPPRGYRAHSRLPLGSGRKHVGEELRGDRDPRHPSSCLGVRVRRAGHHPSCQSCF